MYVVGGDCGCRGGFELGGNGGFGFWMLVGRLFVSELLERSESSVWGDAICLKGVRVTWVINGGSRVD